MRATLAFWKSQGKTVIVSEHRLYYLRGLADRFIYITAGKVEKDYSAAEFERLTEQQRVNLGLRTFILEDLLPPKALPPAREQMELHNFCFAYKNEPETLHIRECEIPANRIVGIIGIMEPGNPLSPDVSAVWKSVVVKLSGTAELIDLKIG